MSETELETKPEAEEAPEVSPLTEETPEQQDEAEETEDTDLADGEETEDPDAEAEAELVDLEWEGKTHRVSPEIKAAAMRQADYTRKTQAVSDQSKALDAAKAALDQQAEALKEIDGERVQLAVLESQIKALDAQDWDKIEEEDPEEANRLFRIQQRARARADDLRTALTQKQTDLDLSRQRSAKEAHAKAVQDSQAILQKDIKGWNAALATKVGEFAVTRLGWTPEQVFGLTDARMVKTLHAAYVGDLAQRKLSAQTKLKAGDETPPVGRPGGGGAAPSARRTTDPSGDQLSTDEWIKRENERLAKANRR